uniref:Transmembrane protein n=1 Tax=Trypanosoma congolense (strain IL3000) TaxID=1068625 RepID=G0UXZ0_TRYCI|nr:conserved hypothetical protein [Trypanosoma congolense IL3000]
MLCLQMGWMDNLSDECYALLRAYSKCLLRPDSQFCVFTGEAGETSSTWLIYHCFPGNHTTHRVTRPVVTSHLLNATLSYNLPTDLDEATAFSTRQVSCYSRDTKSLDYDNHSTLPWLILYFIVIINVVATVCDYVWKITAPRAPDEAGVVGRRENVLGVVQPIPLAFPVGTYVGAAKREPKKTVYHPGQLSGSENIQDYHEEGVFQPLLTPEEQLAARMVSCDYERTTVSLHGRTAPRMLVQAKGDDEEAVSGREETASSPEEKEFPVFLQTVTEANDVRTDVNSRLSRVAESSSIQRDPSTGAQCIVFLQSIARRAVFCLSLFNSLRRWHYCPEPRSSLNVLNSLRVIAFLWVTLFGTFLYSEQSVAHRGGESLVDSLFYAFVERGVFASYIISTFLVISGFLTFHSLYGYEMSQLNSPTECTRLSQETRKQRLMREIAVYFRFVVSRFVRVIPVSQAVILLLPSLVHISVAEPLRTLLAGAPAVRSNCEKYWWTNLILVNNIIPAEPSKRCHLWAYYVALEFQLVILGPPMYWLRRKLSTHAFALVLAAFSIMSVFMRYLAIRRDSARLARRLHGTSDSFYVEAVYQQPHFMFIPFCIGATLQCVYVGVQRRAEAVNMFGPNMFTAMRHAPDSLSKEDKLGYMILDKLRFRGMRLLLMWCGVVIMGLCICGGWIVHRKSEEFDNTHAYLVVYESFNIFPWCVGLCMTIFPLLLGYGGTLRRVLIHRLWCGPSRLVLVAYLLTPVVITVVNIHWPPVVPMTVALLLVHWVACVIVVFVIALVVYILVEQPCLYISSNGKY